MELAEANRVRAASATGGEVEVADGVACVPLSIVNAYLLGRPGAGDRGWVLVDTGLSLSGSRIRSAAAERFGPNARPAAIILTHGHFDHVGTVKELAAEWDAPVFAHPLELPFLTGRADYPPPDPWVGGGLMTLISPLYSRAGIDLGERVSALPADGTVPGAPGWRWIPTPGHAPGHVSLFRDSDRALVAGDAVITTRQESALAAAFKPKVVSGPPAYFTIDWVSAAASVRKLAALRPEVLATGHGVPMHGEEMRHRLNRLAARFETEGVPSDGRYVRRPARVTPDGRVSVPPSVGPSAPLVLAAAGAATAAGYLVGRRS